MSRHKRLDFFPSRRAGRATNTRAFNSGDCRAKAHGVDLGATFRERHHETAVKGIPGPKRIDRGDFENRQAADSAAVEINDIVRSIADCKERVGPAGDAP